jgi:hypothetical protein
MERFQDALLREELDPGLFRRSGQVAVKKEPRIEQFLRFCGGHWAGDGHSFKILRSMPAAMSGPTRQKGAAILG